MTPTTFFQILIGDLHYWYLAVKTSIQMLLDRIPRIHWEATSRFKQSRYSLKKPETPPECLACGTRHWYYTRCDMTQWALRRTKPTR